MRRERHASIARAPVLPRCVFGPQAWATVRPAAPAYDLVGHQASLLFPLGHVKSTRSGDEEFVAALGASDKWLRFEL